MLLTLLLGLVYRRLLWQGVKILQAVAAVGVGLVLNFIVPTPAGVSTQAWQLLSIFLSTIVGLVISPLPVGAWAFCALTVSIATQVSWAV